MNLIYKLLSLSLLTFSVSALGQGDNVAPPLPEDIPSSPEPDKAKSQIEFYASEYDVTIAEASRRMQVMRQAGALADKLHNENVDEFGGIEIIHRPEFIIVIRFTGDADAKVKALGLSADYTGATVVESWNHSKSRQVAVGNALRKAGLMYQSTLNPDGTIDLFVANKDAATISSLLNNTGLDRPDRVKIISLEKINTPNNGYGESKIIGGDMVYGYEGGCSGGFSVHESGNSNNRYILTTGHCENDLWHDSVYLPYVGERYAIYQPYDFQWHTKGTHEILSNVVKNGTTSTLEITSMYPPSYMTVGQYVCKYGAYTYKTCGNIYSTSVDMLGEGGQFVQVRSSTGANLSSDGDSGAPWFNETFQEGWGVHSDEGPNAPNDAVFMPLVRIRDVGLELLTIP